MAGETYNEIFDNEIDPESPFTESLARRYRDNPIAMIQGASGAPRATSKIITPGGSDLDGALVNGTDLSATGPGFLEVSSLTLSAGKTFPWISRTRVNGNVSIVGATMAISTRPLISAQALAIQNGIIAALRSLSGGFGASNTASSGGGGGAGGDGGRGNAALATGGAAAIPGASFTAMNRGWISRIPLVGGNGESFNAVGMGPGGGSLILLVNGDCQFTSAVISADGGTASDSGSGWGTGGGGAGSILIICNGTINVTTSLTLNARGGAGWNDGGGGQNGGGGGGGIVGLIAAAFTGVAPTINVTGGANGGGASVAGSAGLSLGTITLTEEVINSLMLGAAA